jgi:hypothetical protein
MTSKKAPRKKVNSKADIKIIADAESLLIEKEKRYQDQLKKNRRPQVEKLSMLKEAKKKAAPKVKRSASRSN